MTRTQLARHIWRLCYLIILGLVLVGAAGLVIADDSPPNDNNWRSDSPLLFTQEYHTEIWSSDTLPVPRTSGYESTFQLGYIPWDIACGDLDGDGTDDLVYYDKEKRLHAVNGATGHLLWTNSTSVRQEYGYIHNSIVVSDIDADGDTDILYSESGGWLNIADGLTGTVVERVFVGVISTTPKLVDVDGDGMGEIIVGLVSSGFSPIITCINGRTMSQMWTYTGPMTVARDPAISDIDSDGELEVVLIGGYHRFIDPSPRYYVGSSDHMIALDGLSGEVEWEIRLPSIISHYPVINIIGDEKRCEIYIPGGGSYPKTGYVVDGKTGTVIDTINDTGGGYFVYGDWDSDGIDEVFYRGGYYVLWGGLYIYEDGHERGLLSSSIHPTVAQFMLVDWDGDGRSEIIFNSRGPGPWKVWMLESGQQNATILWDDGRFMYIGDLDGDGTSEMLLDMDGTLTLVSANLPMIEASMSRLDFANVTYPVSVVNEIDATIEFQGPSFSVGQLSLVIGNDSTYANININVTSGELHIVDGLDGSVRIISHDIQGIEGGRGYHISVKVQFNWTYPIDESSWISMGMGYHEAFRMDLPKVVEFRVEKGLELFGIIRMSCDSGESLPAGDWTSSGQTVLLNGLSVVHRGSDVPAPFAAFGVRLSFEDDVLAQADRGSLHGNLSMEFIVPEMDGPSISGLDPIITLCDLTPGASSDDSISFHLQIDNEPPVLSEVQPDSGTWTNNRHVLCSALLSDGDGAGIDPTRIEVLVDGIVPYSLQVTSIKAIEKVYVASIAVDAGLKGGRVVRWRIHDLAFNEWTSEPYIYRTDMDPPVVTPLSPRSWTNNSRVLVEARVLDRQSGLRDHKVQMDLYDENGILLLTKEIAMDADGVAQAYLDADDSGVYRCTWSVTDIAGNNGSYIQYILVDRTAPQIEAVVPWIFNTTTGRISLALNLDDHDGSGPDFSSLRYRLDSRGSEWTRFDNAEETSRSAVTVEMNIQGDESIWIFVRDCAGNSAVTRDAYLLNLNEQPVTRLNRPVDGETYFSTRISFDAGGCFDPEGLPLTYTWTIDGALMEDWDAIEMSTLEFGKHIVELEISDGFQTAETGSVVFHIEDKKSSLESHYLIVIIVSIVLAAVIVMVLQRWRLTQRT